LLDPAAWQEGLEEYALAMHLAVALVDSDGRPVGPWLNPRPLWELLRRRQPARTGECPVALAPLPRCTCVADALTSGGLARARDRTGLVHFAVPLVLGGQRVGALIAGQVFDQYPEQLPLEQVAKQLDLSPARVWQAARLEHPVSPHMLRVYEALLSRLGQAFLENRYHTLLEATLRAEREREEEALRRAYDELEQRVEERTAELMAAQATALQAERLAAIGQVAAGLSHESRNALQRGQACLSLLALEVEDRPNALALVRRSQKAQDDLRHLYEDVREYAAPIHIEPRPCDLAQVWREAWADLGRSSDQAPAELREDTGGLDLRCPADPFQVKQVFHNLLDNALDAGGRPVVISIRCSAAEIAGGPAVRVAVRDSGPGFAAEQRSRLFEPFYTTKARGTGLGLNICRRIVEAHGGTIAAGENTTGGAEVVVTLPCRSP